MLSVANHQNQAITNIKQNFQLNNCAIPSKSRSRHWSKLLLNAVLFFTNLKYKIRFSFQFSFGFRFSLVFELHYSNFRQNLAFHAIFRLSIVDNYNFSVQKIVIKLLKSENCLWRFQNKNRKQISLVGQQFSVTIFSKNLAEW